MKKTSEKLLGKVVYIKRNIDSMYAGEWGVITFYDGDNYHVAMWCGETRPIFNRKEFTVPKRQWYYGYEKHHQKFLDKWGIKE